MSDFGPYFDWQPWRTGAGWRPFTDLLDVAVVEERVAVARRTLVRMAGLPLDAVGEREVASITFLGWAARLVSPPLGAAALTGELPGVDLARLWWRPVEGGPLPIASDGPAEESFSADAVRPLLDVFAKRFSLPEHLLWGNVASALGGALTMISSVAPGPAGRAVAVVEELLGRPPLQGTAILQRRRFLKRRNCCLYYRIPGGGTCGDCVLNP